MFMFDHDLLSCTLKVVVIPLPEIIVVRVKFRGLENLFIIPFKYTPMFVIFKRKELI